MMGLMLSLLYVGWKLVFSSLPFETVYLSATNFLFWWYAVWSIMLAVPVVIFALIIVVCGGFVGADTVGGKVGTLLGVVGGGAVSLWLIFIFLLRRALFTGGAWLLHTALVHQG